MFIGDYTGIYMCTKSRMFCTRNVVCFCVRNNVVRNLDNPRIAGASSIKPLCLKQDFLPLFAPFKYKSVKIATVYS